MNSVLAEKHEKGVVPLAIVFSLQKELDARIHPSKRIPLPLRHFFANGVYVREITMPAGAVVVGHIHKHEHIAIMIQGDMSIYDNTGLQRMKAPHTFISRAGVKRALYIHEDVIFTTIHRMKDPSERGAIPLPEWTPEVFQRLPGGWLPGGAPC